ncbi:MAG TPA: lipoyl(octanoyl) transferase LipB [Alcanivoracaceae bacterium]|nr:lipoyl(octanoyl) transferase LipB [Alcanivoracaceae bacterium]
MTEQILHLRYLTQVPYEDSWQAMRAFTSQRDNNTPDELWILEHPPVYTLGQAGVKEHILNTNNIPVVQCDRGGQVTYHGPGQTVIYLLIDLARKGMGARALVSGIENAIVAALAPFGINANPRPNAPGVYVDDERKIASLGLRISRGRSYHGLALNRHMDMSPFLGINPCGYAEQPMTSLQLEGLNPSRSQVEQALVQALQEQLALTQNTLIFETLPAHPLNEAATMSASPSHVTEELS